MYYIILRYNMGRKYQGDTLYWRKLRNGKYTWKKATPVRPYINDDGRVFLVTPVSEEEE